MKHFVLGLIIGIILIPIGIWFYLQFGNVPVATADTPFPFERIIVGLPLHERIERDEPKSVPIEASETNLQTGAQIYRQNCATCHGVYGIPSKFAPGMFPVAPQLWQPHGHRGVVGVSDDPPQETYWKVANGIRLSGMPAYSKLLNETQMWQVSLLLANAAHPLPEVLDIIKKPLDDSTSPSQ